VAKKKERDTAALDVERKKRQAEKGDVGDGDDGGDDEPSDLLADQQDDDVIF
jgi:hypothetical protein